MYYMAKSKFLAFALFILFLKFLLFAVPAYEKDFIRGDITCKIAAVERAASAGDNQFLCKSIDFCLSAKEILGNDASLDSLMLSSATALNINALVPHVKEKVSADLGKAFTMFSNGNVRIAILDKFLVYLSPENLQILNSFIAEKAQSAADCAVPQPLDAVCKKTLAVLKKFGDKNSFSILFSADMMDVWSDNRTEVEVAYAPLAYEAETELLRITDSSDINGRIKILRILKENDVIPYRTKGKVAEKIFSDEIFIIKDNLGITSEKEATLYTSAVSLIADCRWTRSAQDLIDSFPYAGSAYKEDLITTDQFSQVITDIAYLAWPGTGELLSRYLNTLNKDMENGRSPEKRVVLSVIKALGGLGDKAAFDNLLYVTYLNYPGEVTDAARVALAKLKW